MEIPKYETIYLNMPADNPVQRFSIKSVKQVIKHKTRHYLKLDTDPVINMKKLAVLRYEIRKGKYLDDAKSVFIVKIGPATPYCELLQVIRICKQEQIKQYALMKNEFVIIPADPVPETPVQKQVRLLYL